MSTTSIQAHQRALAAAYTALADAQPEGAWQPKLCTSYADVWPGTLNGPRGGEPDRRNRTDCAPYYQWLHDTMSAYQENNWLVEYSSWFGDRTWDSITEVGCGNGKFLRAIAPRAERVVGLDWALSNQLADLPPNVSVAKCNLLSDPISPAQLICSADVLEHMPPEAVGDVVAKLHAAGSFNFHAIACYDDGHSHLTIMPPDAWLMLFQTVSPAYRLLGVDARRDNPNTLVCLIANLPS
jgi:SAM-dependent methyltransferase